MGSMFTEGYVPITGGDSPAISVSTSTLLRFFPPVDLERAAQMRGHTFFHAYNKFSSILLVILSQTRD